MSVPAEQNDPFTRKFGVKPRKQVKGKARSAIGVRPPSTGPPAVEMPLTISVVEAARRLGIGRNSAYAAIERGELPVIKIGKLLRVPVRPLERMLDAAIPENEAAE
jgi:excisionase family DNA binding protein